MHPWHRVHQAERILEHSRLPNGVADADVRRAARTTMLSLVVRRLTSAEPRAVSHGDCVAVALEVLAVQGDRGVPHAYEHLRRCLDGEDDRIVRLIPQRLRTG